MFFLFPSPAKSTVSSTPSRASTLAKELPDVSDVPGSSTAATPLATPKEDERVKSQVLQTVTPPSTVGGHQQAKQPGKGHGVQQT